jgi:TonB-linked SusC/RagA family outer membrane protein
MTKNLLSLIMLLLFSFIFAQKTVTGTITDSNNVPIPGATVFIKGTTTGTTTDFDGNYSLSVKDDNVVLQISYLGYKTVEIGVANKTTIDLTLQEKSESLNEVIVTAFGIKKSKRALGYAVDKLDSGDLEQRPEADLAQTLKGKVAGVDITTSSGQTGAASQIRIRGNISLTGSNAPLLILDNVPFAGTIRDIDPNNIESLSVLKGFSASVLYGSEGRNGVILIQTKTGNAEFGEAKLRVTASSTAYVNEVSQLPEYHNRFGQGQEREFIPNFLSNDGPLFSDLDEVPHPYSNLGDIFPEFAGATVPYTAKPDNVRNLFKTGAGTIQSISISSSQEKTAFNLSAGYTDEEGIIGNNDLKRFNISMGGKAQLSDKLDISATLNYSNRKVSSIFADDVFTRIFYLPRNIDITTLPYENPATGESVYYRNDTNPLWILANSGDNDDQIRVFGTFKANYQLSDALNLSYRVGYDVEQFNSFNYSNRGGFDNDAFRTGFLNIGARKEIVVDQTLILGYNKAITNDFNLNAQVGINSKLTNREQLSTNLDGQLVYNFLRPNNFRTSESSFTTRDENIAGIFAQFQFDYKNYLYTTLSGRYDRGSTVEAGNQTIFYPGASVSFIPTSAFDFLQGNSTVNYLKLRAAYGTSSGYPSAYRTRNTFIIDPMRFAAGDGTMPITNRFSRQFANPNLKPEIHREFEVGIESKFFNNRVTLDASAYKRISEDQIVRSPLSISTAFDFQFINLGRIDNEGVEINLGIDAIDKNDFKWNLRNIFTAEESLVVRTTATGANINLLADRWAVEGQPYGVIRADYALRDDEGNFLINGNGGNTRQGEIINSADIGLDDKVIGDPNPDWRLTTINSVSYKNFNFSVQLEYQHGGEISSFAVENMLERLVTKDVGDREGSFIQPGFLADSATGELFLDENGNKIPNNIQLSGLRTVFSNYYNNNDLRMFDTDLFRIRELVLGYTFDTKENQNIPFDNINLKFTARNLWYIAPNFPKYLNFDPTTDRGLGGSTVPNTKRFALGVTVNY